LQFKAQQEKIRELEEKLKMYEKGEACNIKSNLLYTRLTLFQLSQVNGVRLRVFRRVHPSSLQSWRVAGIVRDIYSLFLHD